MNVGSIVFGPRPNINEIIRNSGPSNAWPWPMSEAERESNEIIHEDVEDRAAVAKKIRIVSDGTILGSRVYDADGNDISSSFTSFSIELVGDTVVATLTTTHIELDIVAEHADSETE